MKLQIINLSAKLIVTNPKQVSTTSQTSPHTCLTPCLYLVLTDSAAVPVHSQSSQVRPELRYQRQGSVSTETSASRRGGDDAANLVP